MGGIIMIASIIIWFLGYYPNHNDYNSVAEQQENSYIGQIGKAIEPVIEPLGFDWKLGIGLISGVGAKELVVSTLGVLYTNESDVENVNLSERISGLLLYAVRSHLFPLYCHNCCHSARIRQLEVGFICSRIYHHIGMDSILCRIPDRKSIHIIEPNSN